VPPSTPSRQHDQSASPLVAAEFTTMQCPCPLSVDGKALFDLEKVPVTRYRYRANIPTPWALNPA
jgi:hypothetical protein